MLFSELYSAYYNAVAAILNEALVSDLQEKKFLQIAKKYAFGESFITIEDALKNGRWPLLDQDQKSVIKNIPEMPLTNLQKRWLKAISLDPRIKLFDFELPDFPDVEPLFRQEDICVFDKYADGDDYTDEQYIKHFRLILDAIKNRYPLKFNIDNRKGRISYLTAQPEYIEYSEKDDKFRVMTSGCRYGKTINIGRIISCKPAATIISSRFTCRSKSKDRIVMEVTNERNALERVLLHFAHFAKEAERINRKHYRVTIEYDVDDKSEMIIRVLSFGPLVKVVGPDDFRKDIIERLIRKKSCEH